MENQLSFTEQDVKDATAFVNFVFKRASWNVTTQELAEFHALYIKMVKILKMMEDHIMELKTVIKPSEDKKGKK